MYLPVSEFRIKWRSIKFKARHFSIFFRIANAFIYSDIHRVQSIRYILNFINQSFLRELFYCTSTNNRGFRDKFKKQRSSDFSIYASIIFISRVTKYNIPYFLLLSLSRDSFLSMKLQYGIEISHARTQITITLKSVLSSIAWFAHSLESWTN